MSEPLSFRFARMICTADLTRMPAASLVALRISVADTVGCALGAARLPQAPDMRAILAALMEPGPVPVIGGAGTAAAGAAAFANAALGRYLDFNDTYVGARNSSHPSDIILGLASLAAHKRIAGERLAEAIAAGYACTAWFSDHCTLIRHGWDAVTPVAISTCAGACKLLGLDEMQTAHAIGIAAVDNVTLFETRVGEISHWKALASGSAARKGLFAAQVAGAGVTGPLTGLDGKLGLLAQIRGEPDTLEVDPEDWKHAVTRVYLKAHSVQYFVQSAVEAGLAIAARGIDAERIRALRVRTNADLIRGTAADRTRWQPATRETADHSLPFCLSVPILFGALRIEHFEERTLADARLHALMAKVEVREDPELTRAYPGRLDLFLEVECTDGKRFEVCIDCPPGYGKRRLTAGEARAKFDALVAADPDPGRCQMLWDAAYGLVTSGDVRAAMHAIAAPLPG